MFGNHLFRLMTAVAHSFKAGMTFVCGEGKFHGYQRANLRAKSPSKKCQVLMFVTGTTDIVFFVNVFPEMTCLMFG